ncbi:fibrobacter succinogenes major paralogous domain-containing protein [candidate division KSB1 bacterium]|nr:fibrobacter succinogenes major paralogous domain-containing protein [candidate division KSB1 bacterium]
MIHSRKMLFVLLFFSSLFIMCDKKNPTSSEEKPTDKPPACDMSGVWDIVLFVTGGNQMPTRTPFQATLVLKQTEKGNVAGTIAVEPGLTNQLTGKVYGTDFNFEILQNEPCTGQFQLSGTVTEDTTEISGTYSGEDCLGTLRADFASFEYEPFLTGIMTDIDGNTYPTIKIGDLWWTAENLKVTHYRNGDAISNVTDDSVWISLTTGAYCNYDNEKSYVATYGRLYNWYAVNDERGIAPEGWHVPSEDEWQQLEQTLGIGLPQIGEFQWRGWDEGGKLKEAGTAHWLYPNEGATNRSGFSALPAGERSSRGYFSLMRSQASFWSATERLDSGPWIRELSGGHSSIYRAYLNKDAVNGLSVRLVKD